MYCLVLSSIRDLRQRISKYSHQKPLPMSPIIVCKHESIQFEWYNSNGPFQWRMQSIARFLLPFPVITGRLWLCQWQNRFEKVERTRHYLRIDIVCRNSTGYRGRRCFAWYSWFRRLKFGNKNPRSNLDKESPKESCFN